MKIETIRKEKEIAAELMLKTQFKMESIIYTQDSTYSKILGKRKREDEQQHATGFAALVNKNSNSNANSNDNSATLKEMTKHLKSYYHVSLNYMLYILVYIVFGFCQNTHHKSSIRCHLRSSGEYCVTFNYSSPICHVKNLGISFWI